VNVQCPYLNLRTEPTSRHNVDYKQRQLLYTAKLVASVVEHVTCPLTASVQGVLCSVTIALTIAFYNSVLQYRTVL